MPLTLGCPSCGRRFRARDESAGRRVRCPFCRAVVGVPSVAAIHNAAAPTEVVAPLAVPPPFPLAGSGVGAALRTSPIPAPAPTPDPEPDFTPTESFDAAPPPVAEPAPTPFIAPPAADPAARGWDRLDRGLFWVEFGLAWLAVAGCVWAVADWAGASALGVLPYAAPGMVGLLAVLLGRGVCATAGVPGAGRLFAASAAGGLVVLAGVFAVAWAARRGDADGVRASAGAVLAGAAAAEFWFLLGLGLVGPALARPAVAGRVASAAGCVGLAGWLTTVAGPADRAVLLVAWLGAGVVYASAVRAARAGIDGWFRGRNVK